MRGPLLLALVLAGLTVPAIAQDPGAELVRARGLMAEKKFLEAARAFEEVIRLSPADVEGHKGAALAYSRIRRFGEAVATLHVAAQIAPDDPAILFDLAMNLEKQARYAEAVVQWRRLESLAGTNDLVSQRPEIPFNRGLCAIKLELIPEAVEALSRAVAMSPDRNDFREQLAGVLINEGRFTEAAREFKELVRRLPTVALHHYHLGVASMQTGDDALAEKHLKEARRLNPPHYETSVRLGKLYLRQRKNDEAFTFFLEASEKNPLTREAWYNLARLAALKRHDDEVEEFTRKYRETQARHDAIDAKIRDLGRVLLAHPDDVATHFELAQLQLENGAFEFGRESLLRLLVISPRHDLALLNLASLLARENDYQGALYEIEKLLEADPGHPWANLDAGRLCMILRDWRRGLGHLERTLERLTPSDDRYVQAVGLYGDCAFEARALAAVAPRLGRALAQITSDHPDFPRLALRYAQAALEAKTPAIAIPVLESAAGRVAPGDPLRPAVFQMLARLAKATGDEQRAQSYLEVLKGP